MITDEGLAYTKSKDIHGSERMFLVVMINGKLRDFVQATCQSEAATKFVMNNCDKRENKPIKVFVQDMAHCGYEHGGWFEVNPPKQPEWIAIRF